MKVIVKMLVLSLLLAGPISAIAASQQPRSVVPQGHTYVFYKDSKMIKTVGPGRRWRELIARQFTAPDVVCVEIACPPGLPKGANCWRCT
jgi:hypothetical protein